MSSKKLNGSDRDLMIQETHDNVKTLTAVILGVPGSADKGLVGKVEKVCNNQETLEKAHNSLKTTVMWLIGTLVGAGVLTGAGFGIDTLINGG